jgi:hypothetical protein
MFVAPASPIWVRTLEPAGINVSHHFLGWGHANKPGEGNGMQLTEPRFGATATVVWLQLHKSGMCEDKA